MATRRIRARKLHDGESTVMGVPADSIPGATRPVGFGGTDVSSLFAARPTADSSPAETDSAESQPACVRIDVERSCGVWVLTLHGDHDVSTQPILREQLKLVTDAGGPIVVDLSRATFLDSTVIGALALAAGIDGQAGAPLTLVAPANYVGTRMVELVGIGSRIPVYRTRTEAVSAHVQGQLDGVGSDVVGNATQVAHDAAAARTTTAAEPARDGAVKVRGSAHEMMASDR
jgi:anti-sigma B factor antagonist